jgi:transposase-like protein
MAATCPSHYPALQVERLRSGPGRVTAGEPAWSCGWQGYAWFVRYADGGGLTAESRARREAVRLQAAEMFAQDADPVQIGRSLRVSTKSVYQWRRACRAGGQEARASRGPGGSPCRLDEGQLERCAPRWRPARPLMAGRRTSAGPWPAPPWPRACSESPTRCAG